MSMRPERDPRAGNSLAEFQRDLADNLVYERGTAVESASAQDAYWALAMTIRDRLADRRGRTARANYVTRPMPRGDPPVLLRTLSGLSPHV